VSDDALDPPLVASDDAALDRLGRLLSERPPAEDAFFEALTNELGPLLDARTAQVVRFDPTGEMVAMSAWAPAGLRVVPVGTRWRLSGVSVAARAQATARPARVDDYQTAQGEIPARVRKLGVRAAVAAPVIVTGKVWGAIIVSFVGDDPPPADVELRVARFAELAARAL
jgi:GAF domain-containing protein